MPRNYSQTLAKLRDIADNEDVSESSLYSKEASKALRPKRKIDKDDGPHEEILRQVETEFNEAYVSFKTKINKYLTRLKLYNNQMRQEDAIGSPDIFTNHQTVLASLYYDKLAVEYEPREQGDEEVAENMNALSEFDYDEMNKAWNDYQWDWDTGFYGWGLKWIYEFDRKSKTPIQTVWDPASFLRDPRAKSVNGDRNGSGAMRFGGLEVLMTIDEMESNPEYFNLGKLRRQGRGNYNTLTYEADQERRRAQGISAFSDNIEGENEQYSILRWLTNLRIGDKLKKCIVETGNERKIIVRITPLETDYWPLIKRDMFPMSHSWDGVSIPDLTEDKQRFRAMLLNVIGKGARADVEPMYLFDKMKVNANTDFKFGFNKFIPINGPVGENVVLPLRKAQPGSVASYVLDFLDISMQKALATPEIRQGIPSKDQRTLGETQLVSAGVDTRYSLTARIWGISEREEWRMYYDNYLRNFKEGIDSKVVRLTGQYGPVWRKLQKETIVAKSPQGLDIKIESREVANQKKRIAFQQAAIFVQQAFTEPSADRQYALRFFGKQAFPREVVERILPLSVDELIARDENKKLDKGEAVEVLLEDNHPVHLRENSKANDNSATRAHIQAHREAMIMKRVSPQAFPILHEDIIPGQAERGVSSAAPAIASALGQGGQVNPPISP